MSLWVQSRREVNADSRGRRVWAELLCWGFCSGDCIGFTMLPMCRSVVSWVKRMLAVVQKVEWMMGVDRFESHVTIWCNRYLRMSLAGVACCQVILCISEQEVGWLLLKVLIELPGPTAQLWKINQSSLAASMHIFRKESKNAKDRCYLHKRTQICRKGNIICECVRTLINGG